MIITQGLLPIIRERHKKQAIVYCSGSFDLLHASHIAFLLKCKAQGDILVVGVGSDYDIRLNKGNGKPIINEKARLYCVDNLKSVDYCLLNKEMKIGEHPLESESQVLNLLRPDIYMVNEEDYDIPYRQLMVNKYGVKLVIGKRECGEKSFSTTEIINKIIREE